jgi:hypothetical protein
MYSKTFYDGSQDNLFDKTERFEIPVLSITEATSVQGTGLVSISI